jgi:peroxiredoxin
MTQSGGTVLGIDMLDVTEHAQEFIRKYELSYPMLKDKDGEGIDAFGVIQYPETFVIDRQGRIAAALRGAVDEDWMRANVAPLLEES